MSITIGRCWVYREETVQVQQVRVAVVIVAAGLAQEEWEDLQAQAQEVFVNVRSVVQDQRIKLQRLVWIWNARNVVRQWSEYSQ